MTIMNKYGFLTYNKRKLKTPFVICSQEKNDSESKVWKWGSRKYIVYIEFCWEEKRRREFSLEENFIIEHLWEQRYTKERCDDHDGDFKRHGQTMKGKILQKDHHSQRSHYH